MAKRFTDTDKWKRPWFNSLPREAKLVWFYLLDICDHAGILSIDFKLLNFQLQTSIDSEQILLWFNSKLIKFNDKFFIPSFIDFQYGKLNESVNAHKSVIHILKKEGVYELFLKGSGRVKDKDKDKDKDQDQDQDKEGGLGETKTNLNGFMSDEEFKQKFSPIMQLVKSRIGIKYDS